MNHIVEVHESRSGMYTYLGGYLGSAKDDAIMIQDMDVEITMILAPKKIVELEYG